MQYDVSELNGGEVLTLYRQMRLARMIEEKMRSLLRQGKITKWFSGIGQEAISVAAVSALQQDEYILPMHRNLGVFIGKDIPLYRLFAQWMGKMEGFTKGRDRSFHFGSPEHHLVGMISHLGPQLAVANGIAMDDKLKGKQKCTLVFTGEGGTSEGDFHEALNVAAVWSLPVIFLIENNGYALSTPTSEQYACAHLVDRAIGYGMEGIRTDGNNVAECYKVLNQITNEIRKKPKPVLVEAETFRRRGHEEASGTKYVPKDLMEYWEQKDPIEHYERFLLEAGYLSQAEIEGLENHYKNLIKSEWKKAEMLPELQPHPQEELRDLYAPIPSSAYNTKPKPTQRILRFVDAIAEGMAQAMEQDPTLLAMGQDIAEYGGVFKVTEAAFKKFPDRVWNTPLCESAILGAALGLSIQGRHTMVEMQFADFVSSGFNQIVNNLAKVHYRWSQPARVCIRMPCGGQVGAGPFHSQSNEAWFLHNPGLKVVYPSNPYDAKGLLATSLSDPNPVLYFEHKALYRKIEGPVPEPYYTLPLGKAARIRKGEDLSIITYGLGVHWAMEVAQEFPQDAIEIIDLRTLQPLDLETIQKSVQKTAKVLVLHEASETAGFGAELAAWIGEYCFEYLDGPVARLGSLDTPVPFNAELEQQYLALSRLKAKIESLLHY